MDVRSHFLLFREKDLHIRNYYFDQCLHALFDSIVLRYDVFILISMRVEHPFFVYKNQVMEKLLNEEV